MPLFAADYLRQLNVRLFEKMAVPPDVAGAVSAAILENCLYGHDTHGMVLIPRFLRDIESGTIRPDARMEVLRKSHSTVLMDGHRGFGPLTMQEAMQEAMGIAGESGVCAATVTNCNHVGILWNCAKTAVESGMIGMIWCVSGPEGGGGCVAPFGGIKSAIGANPMAVGIPAGEMKPLVLDISTSAVAGGKILLQAQQGGAVPLGWLLDEEGNPTTDPNALWQDGKLVGTLLPMAGYKGFGLGLIAEILGGLLSGYGASHMPDYREGQGIFLMVINVEAFVPFEKFGRETDALFRHIKAVPTDSETEEILIPGELEYRTREQRERENSIPVTDAVWADLCRWAKKLGVATEDCKRREVHVEETSYMENAGK